MGKPDYLAPCRLEDALVILAQRPGETKIIAGGTDLIPRLRNRLLEPGALLDLRNLHLDKIQVSSGQVHIGAAVTHTNILESELLARHYPALVQAAGMIAGPPVRNRGTLGGNLVNASPAADLAGPLLAYDASLLLVRYGAQRLVPLTAFFVGPGQTILQPDEILTEIHLPEVPVNTSSHFIKLGKRNAMAVAVASVSARLTLDATSHIDCARIALGSVAPRPLRAVNAERLLEGRLPTVKLFAQAAIEASAESTPITDIRASGDYRRKMVAVLTRRALVAALKELELRL